MSSQVRKKLAYVVKRYPRFSETFIVNEILAHERAGWDVSIFSLLPPVDTHFQSSIGEVRAPVTYLPAKPKITDLWSAVREALQNLNDAKEVLATADSATAREVCQAISLAQQVSERRIEHLHAHFATSASEVARLASRLAKTPFSFTAHAKDIFHRDVSAADLDRRIADAATVVTVSDFNVNHLRNEFPLHAEKITRVYNSLNLEQFPFQAGQERPPQIVAVGRLVEKKGFAVLIEACALLASQGSGVRCKILGYGPLQEELQRQISQLGLTDSVSLTGSTQHRDVIACLRESTLLIAPCVNASDGDRDGLPTVVLEAMALGTPCVGTDVTGMPEVLRDLETGFAVPQSDPAALAAKIRDAIGSVSLRKKVATNARRLIETNFDVDRNAEQLRQVFLDASLASAPRAVVEAC